MDRIYSKRHYQTEVRLTLILVTRKNSAVACRCISVSKQQEEAAKKRKIKQYQQRMMIRLVLFTA
jgi:hypothetical protein